MLAASLRRPLAAAVLLLASLAVPQAAAAAPTATLAPPAAATAGGSRASATSAPPAAAPRASGATRLIAVDDLFALRAVVDPRLSPDGKWVAYTVETLDPKKDKKDSQIYMVATAPGAAPAQRMTGGDKPAHAPRFSPDGRYLAFLSGREGCHDQVWLLNRAGGEAERVSDFKADVADLAWSADGRRLALVVADPDPDEPPPPADAAAKPADGDACGKDAPPRPIVIRRRQFKRDGEGYLRELRNHVYVLDLADRSVRQVTSGPYDDSEPTWSPDGGWIAFTSNRTPDPDANQNSDIFVVAAAGGTPRAVAAAPSTDLAPAWSPDGKLIAYVEGGDPKDMWYGSSHIAVATVFPAASGGARSGAGAGSGSPAAAAPATVTRQLTAALDRNATAPRFSADGRDVYFLVEEGGNSHLARVPVAAAAGGAGGKGAIERVVDGERVVESFDIDSHGDVTVLESVPERPSEVSLVTRQGLRRLTATNDKVLAGLRLSKVQRFQARSADGTPVDGFLTLPPDAPPGARLPAILRIHGGPTSQYDTAFRFEWQLLAAHGYAVVSANPRGSTGYGLQFARALWADWGTPDFADVMAAVDHAVAIGVADPDRLGVGGWSYGGILTDYVITKTTRFKAAIAGASETNFFANYGTDHYQYEWETELGLPWRNIDLWKRLSPWFDVDKITTPTLILCGTDDANVPALNSEQLYQALRRLGRDTELVLYPGQTHSLSRPSFLKDRYDRYLAWYDKYLKPAAATPTASTASGR